LSDQALYPDTAAEPSRSSNPAYPGPPRWVKVSGIVALVIILLFVGLEVASGGGHNPMGGEHGEGGAGGQHNPLRHLGIGAPGDPGAIGYALLAAQEIQRA